MLYPIVWHLVILPYSINFNKRNPLTKPAQLPVAIDSFLHLY